ncbi:diacylglycerol kinase family protein [Verrucomicrobiales bacterium]|nr:diacylglycerol kinase family protein [Verrucomicrobiales bacterium]
MRSFYYAFRGLFLFFRSQRNARIHLFFFLLAMLCGFLFGITILEWCLILLCSGLVMTAEAVNTALERLADSVHPDHHTGIGGSKDIAAAAVLITAIAALSVGLIIFVPKLVSWTLPN